MKMRFSLSVLMITLIVVSALSVFPLVRADSTIVYHKVLQSDEEHFYMSIYIYKDADSMATEDFYGVKLYIHGVDDDWYGSFNFIWITINSFNGITDYWQPVTGYYGYCSISFSYWGIGFSIDIPTEWVSTEGGFTDYIKWSKNMFFTHDDMCSAGFYVPEDAGFDFNITVKAEHCELPPSGSPWLDQCSIVDSTHKQLSISASSDGTTDPAPGTYTYEYGSSVPVAAITFTHYVFDYWLLDGVESGSDPTITVIMDADHSLTPNFNWINNQPYPPPTPSGPTSGYRNVSYTYSTSTTDPDGEYGDDVWYQFELTGPRTNKSFTTGLHASGQTVSLDLMWETTDSLGTYYIRVRAQDVYELWSDWSQSLTVTILNREPNTPSAPSGGYIAYIGENYLFATVTTDPDGDNVCYEFDWGDNSPHTISGWYASGQSAYASHTWTSTGTYYVKARANDTYATWSDWSASHPVTVYSGSGGGGDPCPVLFVWNGDDYVDYGVINIHNPSGEDVIKEVPINVEDVSISNYQATFKLREGWEGLNFSESVIDQVKLYAVDNYGNRHLCPLINATHSTLGNVWLKLILSDNWKTQMLLLETIDLKFLVPYQNIQNYVFVIEGCNQIKE